MEQLLPRQSTFGARRKAMQRLKVAESCEKATFQTGQKSLRLVEVDPSPRSLTFESGDQVWQNV
jgi:hypothetical protein